MDTGHTHRVFLYMSVACLFVGYIIRTLALGQTSATSEEDNSLFGSALSWWPVTSSHAETKGIADVFLIGQFIKSVEYVYDVIDSVSGMCGHAVLHSSVWFSNQTELFIQQIQNTSLTGEQWAITLVGATAFVMLCIILLYRIYLVSRQYSPKCESANNVNARTNAGTEGFLQCVEAPLPHRGPSVLVMAGWVLGMCLLVSIPWEFIRIYQAELAKKAAITLQGLPVECQPERMTMWQSLRHWLRWQFSWSPDPCEAYHQALMVDPIWEVTPLMVISAVLARCITKPMEILSTGLGSSFRLLMTEIPALWQPYIIALLTIIILLAIIMLCGYRVSLPMLFKIEPPKTKITVNSCTRPDCAGRENFKGGRTKSIGWRGDHSQHT